MVEWSWGFWSDVPSIHSKQITLWETSALHRLHGDDNHGSVFGDKQWFIFYEWFRTSYHGEVSNGPLAHQLAHLLAPLTPLLAPYYSLHSRAPLRSLVWSLADSLAPKLVGLSNVFGQFWRRSESLCKSNWPLEDTSICSWFAHIFAGTAGTFACLWLS